VAQNKAHFNIKGPTKFRLSLRGLIMQRYRKPKLKN